MNGNYYPQDTRNKAALSYIPIVNIVFFITEKHNAFIRFHAAQSLIIMLAFLLVWSVFSFFGAIPLIGFLFRFVFWFIRMAFLGVGLFNAVMAFIGSTLRLPFLADIADRLSNI